MKHIAFFSDCLFNRHDFEETFLGGRGREEAEELESAPHYFRELRKSTIWLYMPKH